MRTRSRHCGLWAFGVITPSHDALERTVVTELEDALGRARANGDRLVIHEVGGYAIRALHEPLYMGGDTVIGAIEITKQGVWVAEQLEQLRIPQLNVAQTRLKEVEGKLVGEAVVAALDTILRELGYAVVGRNALVCGYGWVGKGVARSLQQRGMSVSVRDVDKVSLVEATVDGYSPDRRAQLERAPAIVIGASGVCSIDADLLRQLPDRSFIVSGASKNHEIDLGTLARQSVDRVRIHEHVQQCTLDDGAAPVSGQRGLSREFHRCQRTGRDRGIPVRRAADAVADIDGTYTAAGYLHPASGAGGATSGSLAGAALTARPSHPGVNRCRQAVVGQGWNQDT